MDFFFFFFCLIPKIPAIIWKGLILPCTFLQQISWVGPAHFPCFWFKPLCSLLLFAMMTSLNRLTPALVSCARLLLVFLSTQMILNVQRVIVLFVWFIHFSFFLKLDSSFFNTKHWVNLVHAEDLAVPAIFKTFISNLSCLSTWADSVLPVFYLFILALSPRYICASTKMESNPVFVDIHRHFFPLSFIYLFVFCCFFFAQES